MLNENVFYLRQTFNDFHSLYQSESEEIVQTFFEKLNTSIKICLKCHSNSFQSLDEAKFQIFSFLVAKCADQEDETQYINFEKCVELMVDNEFKDFAAVNCMNET
jgi:hypothetical protein